MASKTLSKVEVLSRQQRWQLRKRMQGLCIGCGKRPLATSSLCEVCAPLPFFNRRKVRNRAELDRDIENIVTQGTDR